MTRWQPIALSLLTGIVVGSFSPAEAAEDRLEFTVSDAPWVLTLPAKGYTVEIRKVKPDGKSGYFMLTNRKTDLAVSLFIEPAVKCHDSKSCRNKVFEANRPTLENPENISLSEIGEVSVFEYLLPTVKGAPVRLQNLYAEYVSGGFWVDLHISKALYTPSERHLFEDVITSIKFEPKQVTK